MRLTRMLLGYSQPHIRLPSIPMPLSICQIYGAQNEICLPSDCPDYVISDYLGLRLTNHACLARRDRCSSNRHPTRYDGPGPPHRREDLQALSIL